MAGPRLLGEKGERAGEVELEMTQVGCCLFSWLRKRERRIEPRPGNAAATEALATLRAVYDFGDLNWFRLGLARGGVMTYTTAFGLHVIPAFLAIATACACGKGGSGPIGTSGAGGSSASGGSAGSGGSSSGLQYFTTCGDPVCQSPDPDDPAWPNCTTERAGDECSTRDASCELPGDTCGGGLLCTDRDPTAAGCPKSRARYKTAIDYLDRAELEAVRDRLLKMRMAHWRYENEPPTAPPHLGFIIDDQPDSPAVMGNGERVDLYGYASMAAATIQVQQKQIEALEREMRALREAVKNRCR
jgi:hypothetical protein